MQFPKNPRLENPHLLEMARRVPRPCLLRVRGVCSTLGADTSCCACHGNSLGFNKGGAMKAHDFFSVWGCARCHAWLDASYSAGYAEKQAAFATALRRQIVEWAKITMNITGKPSDLNSARWALEHLIMRGYAVPDRVLYAIPAERFPNA